MLLNQNKALQLINLLDKSIKKPIEIVNLIFNYYVGDGGAEFVSGSEQVIKEVMGLVGEETSI